MPAPFKPEPAYRHGSAPQTAVLYCNLGTPDAPTTAAVRRYLAEFLSDHRVVEIPRLLWLAILHGIILRTRPAKSAAKYASIWTAQGSPLRVWTEQQAQGLQNWLAEKGYAVPVRWAMRYGQPSIASQLDALKAEGAQRILVITAYPQYAGSTVGSTLDAVYSWAQRTRAVPELRFINHYHDHSGYIAAMAQKVRQHWQTHGQGQVLVMSFHGVPVRTLELGDPYHCECHKTARLLAEQLQLKPEQYKVTFQSRLGRAKWLEPYTEPTLIQMAQSGTRSVDVICPAFTSDCLETLEEINMEARHAFLGAGGEAFHYIDCLNADTAWIDALGQMAAQHLQGWPAKPTESSSSGARSRELALTLGAKD